MTEPVKLALIVAGPPTLAGLGSIILGFRNSRKADGIHVLVNSNLTKVKEDLALAIERVRQLESVIKELMHGK